uniref:NAC domain-containing protein n=1 Tax=Oryza brachyantha TaxID=4533 RepID=J3NBU6_ORYBR
MEPTPPPPPAPQQTAAAVLHPGVYFNPTLEEAVRNYVNRWITGEELPEVNAGLVVVGANVYGDAGAAAAARRRRHPPGYTRGHEYKWFFLTHRKVQVSRRGGRGGKRSERHVATGGRGLAIAIDRNFESTPYNSA